MDPTQLPQDPEEPPPLCGAVVTPVNLVCHSDMYDDLTLAPASICPN